MIDAQPGLNKTLPWMIIENTKKRTLIRRFPTASSDRKARIKEVTRSQNE
jgi:hypothetical protein